MGEELEEINNLVKIYCSVTCKKNIAGICSNSKITVSQDGCLSREEIPLCKYTKSGYCEISENVDNAFCKSLCLIRRQDIERRIEACIWTFNPSFLTLNTGIELKVFESLVRIMDSSNHAIKALIKDTCGMDRFKSNALKDLDCIDEDWEMSR